LVLLADDKDGIARRETILNHLKNVFSEDQRRVIFLSDRAIRNEEYRDSNDPKEQRKYRASIPPSAFDLEVRLIWLSNIDFTDPAVIGKLPTHHFNALVSRGV
jgi:hypothetical protein